jgi:peptide/nickel transport system substrate-binding protein
LNIVTDQQPIKELRIKRGSHILGYISRFSATEKMIFGTLVSVALISSLLLVLRVSDLYMTEIPGNGGELREGEIGLPRTINPVIAVSDTDRDISALVYAGLVKYDNGNIVPDIARSWTISTDGLTYDFILKTGVTFHDGTALAAADIVFTIQKIQDPALKSPRQADWTNVTMKEISPSEIQFILKQPYIGFLANATVGIIPKHIWGSVSDDQFIFSQYNTSPIGAGPYKIASIGRDSSGIPTSYNLVPWKGYDASAYIGKISFSFFSNGQDALGALNSGTIDSLPSIDPAEAAKLASNSAESYRILSAPLPRIFGVFFNQNQAPVLADINVRMALNMATDRTAIIKSVLYGYGKPIHGPLPANLSANMGIGTAIPVDGVADTADIAGAKALLEKSGWKKNSGGIYEKNRQLPGNKTKTVSTTLSFDIYTSNSPDLVAVAKMLQAEWNMIGAKVGVQVFEQTDLYQNVIRTRKYDALLFGEQIGKDRDLYAFWHSSQRNAPGLNVALYVNSKVDALLALIRSTTSSTTLALNYATLDRLVQNDIPAVFLYSPDFIYAVPKNLRGMTLGSMVVPSDRWSSVDDWYVETEKVWSIFK